MKFHPTIVVIGPVPPPTHGVTVYVDMVLSSELSRSFRLIHLDTSDHRSLANLGRLDFTNVKLAILNIFALVRILISARPDAVYLPLSQNAPAFIRDGSLIIVTKLLSNAKVVIHHHGGEYFQSFYLNASKGFRLLIRHVLGKVDGAIVLGERLKSVFDGMIRKTYVVPNGVDIGSFAFPRPERNEKRIVVSFLGTLCRDKGILDFLQMAKLVLEGRQGVVFKIAGTWWGQEPDVQATANRFVSDNNLGPYIEFLGFLSGEKKRDFLLSTDIFVFPSLMDGLGIVNLEAMVAGCAVVASRDVGAVSEIVLDGITGFLASSGNPSEFARAVLLLIRNEEMRKSFGEAARSRVHAEYTISRNIERLAAVFEDVMMRGDHEHDA